MISLCLTTYNRTELLYESFASILEDERVSEVIIVDDWSHELIYNAILSKFKNVDKVKVFRNEKNLDCYKNKQKSISLASNEWVIIADSDNVFKKDYIDRIESLFTAGLNTKTLYQPSFAKPHFNFTLYEGLVIDKHNVVNNINDAMFQTMLNAMNYFVNRDEYLKVWDGSVDPVTSDSIFQNYNWLKAGNNIYVVPGLEYEHRIHNDSHYKINVRRTPHGFNNDILNKLKAMK